MKIISLLLLIVSSTPVPVRAALGQLHDSIQSDVEMLNGTRTTVPMYGYSVEEITRGDGAVLREFVTPGGRVFGIAWQGPTMPNLLQLLGPSAPAFQQAVRSSHRRGPISVHLGQLVVQTGGHMRAFRVRAYLADQLPGGISEEVIR